MASERSRIKGITIEIGGDVTKLEAALRSVNKAISTTSSELKDVESLLKLDPSNTELLTQKQSLLATQIGRVEEKLRTLKEAEAQLKEAGVNENSAQFQGLERDIIATEQQLKSLINEYENFGSVAKQQMIAVGDSIEKVGNKIDSVGDGISNIGTTLTKLTSPLAAIGVASTKSFMDFESTISEVAAAMGTTSDQIENIAEKAEELGNTTNFSATEAAEGFVILARAGYDAEEQIALLPNILDMAAAGELELADATNYISGMMLGFNDTTMSASEASQKYADMVSKGASQAKTSVGELGEAMADVSSTASMYGQAAEDVEVALLEMAQQNVTGSEAATRLYRVMTDLYTPTEDAAAILEELGIATYDEAGEAKNLNDVVTELKDAMADLSEEQQSEYLSTIFTQRGLLGYNQLAASSTEYTKELYEAIGDSSGSAAQQAETMYDNVSGALKRFLNHAKTTGAQIGEKLAPMFEKLLEVGENVLEWIGNLDSKTLEMIVTIGTAVTAIGPVLTIAGKVVSAVGNVTTGVGKLVKAMASLNPVTAALTAAGSALVVYLGHCITYEKDINSEYEEHLENVKNIVDETQAETSATQELADSLRDSREARLEANQSIIDSYDVNERYIEILKGITDENGNIVEGHEKDAETILGKLSEAYGVEYSIVDNQIQKYDELIDTIYDTIAAKKAQAVLDANQDDYIEAYTNQVRLAKELTDASKALEETKALLADSQSKLNAEAEHYNYLLEVQNDGRIMELFGNYETWENELIQTEKNMSDLSESVTLLNGQLDEQQSAYNDLSSEIQENSAMMEQYEDLEYQIANGSTEAINDATLALTNGLKTFGTATKEELEAQVEEYQRQYDEMLKASEEGNVKISDAQLQSMKDMVRLSKEQLDLMVEDIANTKYETETQGKLIGKYLAQGMADGTNDYAYLVKNAAGKMANSALTIIKKITGVASPSKQTAWIGQMLDEGLKKGIEQYASLPEKAAATMTSGVLDNIGGNSILTAGQNGNAISSSTTNNSYMGGLTVNVYSSEGQDVHQLAELVSQEIATQYDRSKAVFA